MKLRLKKLGKSWWIVGHPDGPMGPYDTRREAEEDRRGVNRFNRYQNEPGFLTSERRREGL